MRGDVDIDADLQRHPLPVGPRPLADAERRADHVEMALGIGCRPGDIEREASVSGRPTLRTADASLLIVGLQHDDIHTSDITLTILSGLRHFSVGATLRG
jgi:hypothetical protein